MLYFVRTKIGSLLNIYDGEWPRFLALFGLYLIIGIILSIGKNVSEAMFVVELGVKKLPLMFVMNSLVIVVFSMVYAVFADRIKNYRILMYMFALMVMGLVMVFLPLHYHTVATTVGSTHVWGFKTAFPLYFMYVANIAFYTLVPTHFATYLADHYDPLDSKRLCPLITTAGRFGGMIGGIIVTMVAVVWSTELLIILWGGFLILTIAMTSRVERRFPTLVDIERLTLSGYRGYVDNFTEGYQFIKKSKFLIVVALSTFFLIVLRHFLDYLNNDLFVQQFPQRDQLVAFYGSFSAISEAIAAVLQLFVTPRLIARMRVGPAGNIYSITSLISMFSLAIFPPLGLPFFGASLARMNANAFRTAFNNPVYALFFNAVPREIRARSRAFITGLVVPLATCFSGLLLMVLIKTEHPFVTITVLGITAVLAYSIICLERSKHYANALMKLLQEKKFDQLALTDAKLGDADAETRQQLINTFRRDDDQLALFAAEILMEVDPKALLDEIRLKIYNCSNFLQKELFAMLTRIPGGRLVLLEVSRAMINDDSPEIRALTLEFMDIYQIQATEVVLNKFNEGSLREQTMAALYLINQGIKDYQDKAYDFIFDSIRQGHEEQLAIIFECLGKSRNPRFLSNLFGRLTADPSSLNVTILTSIYQILTHVVKETRGRTIYLNEDSERQLSELLNQVNRRKDTTELCILIIRILALFNGAVSLSALTHILGTENYELNDELILAFRKRGSSASRHLAGMLTADKQMGQSDSIEYIETRKRDAIAIILAANQDDTRIKRTLEVYLLDELRRIYQRLVDLSVLDKYKKMDKPHQSIFEALLFFKRILISKNLQTKSKVIKVLSEMGDRQGMEIVKRVLSSKNPRHRAHALEALENISIASVVKVLQNLMEGDISEEEILKFGQDKFDLKVDHAAKILLRYTRDNDGWIRAMSIELVGQIVAANYPPALFAEFIKPAYKILRESIHDINPFVREATCVAFGRMGHLYSDSYELLFERAYDPEEVADVVIQAIQGMIKLRRKEEHLLPDGVTYKEAHVNMLSTIEKTMALRTVEIFSTLKLDQLKTLSTICVEDVKHPDEMIFAEGAAGDKLYIILNGKINIVKHYKQEIEQTLAVIAQGESFGEMTIFDDDEKRSASAIAGDETHLLTIKKDELKALIIRYPDISFGIIKGLSRKLRQTNQALMQVQRELTKGK